MVDSRGGLKAFEDNHLLPEILRCELIVFQLWPVRLMLNRCDLALAVFCTSTPVFFCQVLEPIPPYPVILLRDFNATTWTAEIQSIDQVVDAGLAEAWSVMRRFAWLVNFGAQVQRQISTAIINQTMTSVMYRLLWMRHFPGSLAENLRVSLLTYCYHVFLQWQNVKSPCPHLQTAFKGSISTLWRNGELLTHFMLWMLMVGAVSIFNVQEHQWLEDMLRDHARDAQKSWTGVQDILKSFLRMPLLDEEAGRLIWASVNEKA